MCVFIFMYQYLHPPMNGEAFALSTSLFLLMYLTISSFFFLYLHDKRHPVVDGDPRAF